MASSTSQNDRVGSIFAGKFRIESLLGEGGMGAVYKAIDVNLDRPVALKLIKRELASDPSFAARFKREAKVAAKFTHPNSIGVYDYDSNADGDFYMALEFVQGHELRDLIKAKGGISPRRAVMILGQILGALHEAHELGIVHRDLKPANVMVQEKDRVKILDFGIAKMRSGDGTAALTLAGQIMGTIAYMAPEQTEGSDVDGRADIYAAGVMLFQMLTGKLPFRARNAIEMIKMHRMSPVPSLASVRADIPEAFDDIVRKAMAKKPKDRYQTAGEFRQALEAAPLGELETAELRGSTTVNQTGAHSTGSTDVFYDGLIGKTLDNEFLIQKKLGAGGMGAVFKAKSSLLGNVVAVKVIHPQLADRADIRERFLREARAALEFVHPNAIPTRTCRQTPDGLLYMTMDFSSGRSLRQIIDEDGRLEPGRALGLARQVLHALSEAHRKGIVHRDLKPENMLVERQEDGSERVRVCDFGIAKIMAGSAEGDAGTSLTGQQVLGTPHYMAPEQASGDAVDGRTDVYALGCMLYEMLTGTRVFKAKSAMDVLMKQITNTPDTLSQRAPEANFSPQLEALISKALEKAPAERFQDAEAFIAAIEALPLALPASSFRTTSGGRPIHDTRDIQPTLEPRPPSRGSGKAFAVGLVVVLLGLLVAIAALDPQANALIVNLLADDEKKEGSDGDPTRVVLTPPPVDQQPVDQPPLDQPPVDHRPVDQPPLDQPPLDQPPLDQPPLDQPPLDQPPLDQPPVDQPPVDPPPTDPTPLPTVTPIDVPPVDIGPTTPEVTPVDPTPRPTNVWKPEFIEITKGNVGVRMGRLPNKTLRIAGERKPVRNVWLSTRELTVGQFARMVDSIRSKERLQQKIVLARYLEDYRPPGTRWRHRARLLPNWAWNQIAPARRDEPIRGVPQHVAREIAEHLGLRLPSEREWLWAATLEGGRASGANRAGISGLHSEPYEWLAESGVAGEGFNRVHQRPSPGQVGIRFALDRE